MASVHKNNHVTVLEEKLFKYAFRIGRSKSKEGIGKALNQILVTIV